MRIQGKRKRTKGKAGHKEKRGKRPKEKIRGHTNTHTYIPTRR